VKAIRPFLLTLFDSGLKVNTYILTDVDADEVFGAPNLTGTPERNLLVAILTRAILDFVGNETREVESAGEWIFDEVDSPHTPAEPYSFKWVCQHLDLDYRRIAGKIKAMPKRGNRRIAPWYFMKHEERLAS
jgi:hypothetical protein